MHTMFCLSFGLNIKYITAALDNSPSKIDKYLYNYEIPTKNFSSIVNTNDKKIVIVTGGCYTIEIIEQLKQNKSNLLFFI